MFPAQAVGRDCRRIRLIRGMFGCLDVWICELAGEEPAKAARNLGRLLGGMFFEVAQRFLYNGGRQLPAYPRNICNAMLAPDLEDVADINLIYRQQGPSCYSTAARCWRKFGHEEVSVLSKPKLQYTRD